jgi:hypothetical protein
MKEIIRLVRTWLMLPSVLFGLLLHKLVNFVPRILFRYNEYSARIDMDLSISTYKIDKDSLKQISLNDIKNKNLRRSLKATNIFNNWKVYYAYTTTENKTCNVDDSLRDVIYITKDKLKVGDEYSGQRISEHEIDKRYGKLRKKYLKKLNIKNFNEIEPQMYLIVAKKTHRHDDMKKEREIRYEKKKRSALEKLVKKCIKDDDIIGRSNSITGMFNYDPVAFKVVDADRLDLMQKLIDACDDEELQEMLTVVLDSDGWESPEVYKDTNGYRTLLRIAKSEQMKELIQKNIL